MSEPARRPSAAGEPPARPEERTADEHHLTPVVAGRPHPGDRRRCDARHPGGPPGGGPGGGPAATPRVWGRVMTFTARHAQPRESRAPPRPPTPGRPGATRAP